MRATHIFTTILASVVILFMFSSCGGGDDKAKDSAAAEVWTCPMHPSVISDRPGACPVCHMDLVKKAEVKEMSVEDGAMLQSVSLSPTQRVLANVTTTAASRRSILRTITVVGAVDFAEPLQAVVSARFRGRVERMLVNYTGALVKKGQVLFELYSPELINAQQDYLIAYSTMRKAQESGNAAGAELQSGLLASIHDRLTMHYGLKQDKIDQLESSGKVLHSASFTSPISGTVTSKNVQEGRYIDDGTAVYEIVDLSRVWIYVEVTEQDLRFVRIGQTALLSTAAWPGEEFRGRVTFIDPVMNAQTRTVRVRVESGNPGGRLKPGMYVNGSITVKAVDALVVPATAVIRTGRRDVVWVEAGENRFEPRDVRLGAKSGDYYEVLGGIDEGEMIAETGGYLLDSESTLAHPEAAAAKQHAHEDAGNSRLENNSEPSSKGPREIKVKVKFGYAPEVIRVKAGEKVRLLFHREEDSKCSEEIVFPDFNIRKTLPAFRTTAIDLTPKKKGSYTFSCGMDMLHGTLVVE